MAATALHRFRIFVFQPVALLGKSCANLVTLRTARDIMINSHALYRRKLWRIMAAAALFRFCIFASKDVVQGIDFEFTLCYNRKRICVTGGCVP